MIRIGNMVYIETETEFKENYDAKSKIFKNDYYLSEIPTTFPIWLERYETWGVGVSSGLEIPKKPFTQIDLDDLVKTREEALLRQLSLIQEQLNNIKKYREIKR